MVNTYASRDACLGFSSIFIPRDVGSKKTSLVTIKDKIQYPVTLYFQEWGQNKDIFRQRQANAIKPKNTTGGYCLLLHSWQAKKYISERKKNEPRRSTWDTKKNGSK